MMADEAQNAKQLNKKMNGNNNEEMAEVAVEGYTRGKNNLGAAESMHDVMKVVKSMINVRNKYKDEVYVVDMN